MRFQEHYESPEFKDKTFSVEEFATWYSSKYGAFTYTQDWHGFNIPALIMAPFRQGMFDPLTGQEKQLLEFCKNADKNSYIIGVTSKEDYFEETLRHEFAHAVFFTDSSYRQEVVSCLNDYRIKELDSALNDFGYCKDVLPDEANAYIMIEPDTVEDYISVSNTKKLKKTLEIIFQRHFGFSLSHAQIPALINRTKHILV